MILGPDIIAENKEHYKEIDTVIIVVIKDPLTWFKSMCKRYIISVFIFASVFFVFHSHLCLFVHRATQNISNHNYQKKNKKKKQIGKCEL